MNTKAKGNLAESIVCDFLVSRGYRIMDRNYSRKWGELDIIALKQRDLHFIEVKSDFRKKQDDGYRSEELVHALKQGRLRRVMATYLVERGYGLDHPFIFDLAVVTFGRGDGGPYSIIFHEDLII